METIEEILVRHEGLRNFPYQDTTGHMTIGVGRNLRDNGISLEEAMLLLKNDITHCKIQLDRHLDWWPFLSSGRQNVMVSLCFILGINGLLKFKKMLDFSERGDFDSAAKELLNSKMATQIRIRSLELAKMLREG